ncbi:TonB-dependent receptor [Pelomonas aquatica]|jgi:iron complex outermembrane receptor protein|uniref:TonB-dependent receptor n=1 Tax=Pelomonas aquatica TaxID=431058 RepID=A0A9X4LPP5_9BURK|nr:TonB-dependent receptor [Pelomonas aquatica]MCY4753968.1 TonB-dependent receptor [Pelomonas aquatica]MDG0864865.1 TonB-dependent receptor [Pelomonas aquatica]
MPFSSARFPRPSLLALALSATLPALAQQAADPALERVVVTATRGTKAIDKIPGAVSVITAQEIETQTLVAEDLSQVLSVLAPSYAPSRQKLTSFGESMRGRTALLLFDGVPQSNPLRNGAREGYFADPSLIERIEVISGASAAQGLGATGGIINFISRTPREAGTRQRVELKYGTQGHSDDALWKAGYTLEHKSGFDALLHVGATLRGVGVDGDGRRLGLEAVQGDTQDSRAGDVFLKLGRDFGPQRLQLSVNRFRVAGEGDWKPVAGNRATALPTSAAPGTPPGRPPRNDVRTVSLDWSHGELAGGQAHAQVYKQDFSALYGATAATTFQDTSIAPQGRLFDQSEVVADKAGVKLSWVRPDLFVDGLELTTGLDWLKDTSQQRLALTGRTWVPPLKFTSTAPFAQLEYEVGAFTVRGGARRESAKLAVDGYQTLAFYKSTAVQGGERSFSQWVKSLGAVWRLGGGWSTFVSYNEGFGVPDVGLVLRAVNKAGQSVDKLIALEPVVTDNRELGLAWRGRQGSFSASVYDSRSALGSQIRVDAATGIGSVLRVPVRVKGFEFSGEARPLADWTLSASYAHTRGKTAAQPDTPLDVELGARSQGPDKLVLAAAWQFAPKGNVRLQATRLASRDINVGRVVGTSKLEEHFGGYTLADLAATYGTAWGEFGLGVENLFDRQYIGYYAQSNPAGTNDDLFAGRGRTLTVSWRRSF